MRAALESEELISTSNRTNSSRFSENECDYTGALGDTNELEKINNISKKGWKETGESLEEGPTEELPESDGPLDGDLMRSSNPKFAQSEPISANQPATQAKNKMKSMSNLGHPGPSELGVSPDLPAESKSGDRKEKEPPDSAFESGSTPKPKNARSKSVSTVKTDKQKAKIEIQKDVDRTFQGEKYFKRGDVKDALHAILFQFTETSSLKYVQGMNFIAAYVLNHCLDYEFSFNIFMFLQGRANPENLEMHNLYRMTHLNDYYQLLEETIALNCSALYKTVFKDNLALINNLFVDWLLTLGTSKIPLKFSGEYLEYLVLYGWTYFFKFFGSFARELEQLSKSFLSKIKRKTKEVVLYNNFDIENLPEKLKRSISPIRSKNRFPGLKKLFNKKPRKEEPPGSKITTEKRICFKVKKSKNTMANEEMYIVLKKFVKKLDDQGWENIFNNAFLAKVNKKKIVFAIKWTKYNNFSELN